MSFENLADMVGPVVPHRCFLYSKDISCEAVWVLFQPMVKGKLSSVRSVRIGRLPNSMVVAALGVDVGTFRILFRHLCCICSSGA